MVDDLVEIVWTKRSQHNMHKIYNFIYNDSPKNALKVVEDILKAVKKAISNPEFYGPDKYRIINDGSYRAFEKHYYRVVY